MAPEYNEKMLYTQLKRYESLVNLEHMKLAGGKDQTAKEVPEDHRKVFHVLHTQVEQEVRANEYNWIPSKFFELAFGLPTGVPTGRS